ncbi:MAG: hypothetical protein V1800_10265 [Candidatus Latescibacterota bacterium]
MFSGHALKNGKHRLLWLHALIGVLTLTTVAWRIYFDGRTHRDTKQMATEQFSRQQLILARSAAAGIEAYHRELTARLSSLSKQPSIQQMSPECLQEMQHTYWGFPPRTSLWAWICIPVSGGPRGMPDPLSR